MCGRKRERESFHSHTGKKLKSRANNPKVRFGFFQTAGHRYNVGIIVCITVGIIDGDPCTNSTSRPLIF